MQKTSRGCVCLIFMLVFITLGRFPGKRKMSINGQAYETYIDEKDKISYLV